MLKTTKHIYCEVKFGARQTKEEFVEKLKDRSEKFSVGDWEVTGDYTNCSSKIECTCHIHNIKFHHDAHKLYRGDGCKYCASEKLKNTIMPKEEFVSKLLSCNNGYKNGDFSISGYNGVGKNVLCTSNINGFCWECTGSNLLVGHVNPKCYNKKIIQKPPKKTAKELFEIRLHKKNKFFQNGEIDVIDYKNATSKVKIKCNKCGNTYECGVKRLMYQGRGCPQCDRQRHKNSKTHKEFISELVIRNDKFSSGQISILNKYIDTNHKICCTCNICGHAWESKPSDLLRGKGCAKCAGVYKKNHDEFVESLLLNNKKFKYNNFKLMSEYQGSNKYIKCKCNKCGHEWKAKPHTLLNGCGCPKCIGRHKTNIEFLAESRRKNKNVHDGRISILTEYTGCKNKIKCKCNVCGYEDYILPSSILKGCGCKKCNGTKKHTNEEFIELLVEKNKKYANNEFKILGKYINVHRKIQCACLQCGYIWYVTPHNLLNRGSGCPSCASSQGENLVKQYLVANNFIFEEQKMFDDMIGCRGGNLKMDFYIPDIKTAIEFNGEQHYTPIEAFGGIETLQYIQANDILKREYADLNGIKVIDICYKDINRIGEILDNNL